MTAASRIAASAAPAPVAPAPVAPTRRGRPRLGPAAVAALAVIAALGIIVIVAPIFLPDPSVGELSERLLPVGTPGHVLGTDGQGRDVLARLVVGGRLSLLSGVVPVLIAGSIGMALGVTAGLGRPWQRGAIMRTLDVFYAFPAVLLGIAIAAALGPGAWNAIIALSIVLIPPVARVAETETRRIIGLDFMESASVSGAGGLAIAVRQVVPNVAPPVTVYCTALVGLSIVFAAGFSFLGLGVAPPAAEWGLMVSENTQFIYTQPSLIVIPGLAILVASVAFNVLGDGLRDVLDVKGGDR